MSRIQYLCSFLSVILYNVVDFNSDQREYVIIDNSQPSLMVHHRYTFSFWISFVLHTSLDLHKECNERTATPRMNIKARPGLKQLHSQSPPVPLHLSIKVTRIRPRPRPRPRPAPSASRILLLLQPRCMISLIATDGRRPHPRTTTRRTRIEDGIRILQVRTGRLRRLMGGRQIVPLAGAERWLLGLVERLGVRAGWVVGGRGIVVMMLGLG